MCVGRGVLKDWNSTEIHCRIKELSIVKELHFSEEGGYVDFSEKKFGREFCLILKVVLSWWRYYSDLTRFKHIDTLRSSLYTEYIILHQLFVHFIEAIL